MTQAFNLSQFANNVNTSGQASLTEAVTGTLPIANGGTGTTTPSLVAGSNITITGSFPNQTIAASGGGGLVGFQVFTASGTYTKATNSPTAIFVQVVGGGGGGNNLSGTGSSGGTSSFGAFLSATGGAGAITIKGGIGGLGANGQINLSGGGGIGKTSDTGSSSQNAGVGGNSIFGGGAAGGSSLNGANNTGGGGGGDSGLSGKAARPAGSGGGAGGYAGERLLASALAASETVTVGAGGAGSNGGTGGSGVVIVWEYK